MALESNARGLMEVLAEAATIENKKEYFETLKLFLDVSVIKSLCYPHHVRFATSQAISLAVMEPRDPITYRLTRMVNRKIIKLITAGNAEYETMKWSWKIRYPNTHSQPIFFVPGSFVDDFMNSNYDSISAYCSESQIALWKAQGSVWANHKKKYLSDEEQRIQDALNTIGSCSRCSRMLSINQLGNGQAQKICGNLYCKYCVTEMMGDGTMASLLRQDGSAKTNP